MQYILLAGPSPQTTDRFTIVVILLLILILVVFANRINRLDEALQKLNDRLDGLTTTLVDISNRPCQMESHGFHVHVTRDENASD